MNSLVLSLFFIGNLTATSYRSVTAQTDSSPFHTSTGERVSAYGVAVSQDLLCGACKKLHKRCKQPDNMTKLHYGDLLYVQGVGYKFVNDLMNKRHKNRIDIWVPSYKDEKLFHKKYGIKKQKVWRVQ